MSHPSVDAILAGDAAAGAHVAGCGSCHRLAELVYREPATPTALLPVVQPSMYTDREELESGRGGMGRITRARDVRLGREVAIKEALVPEGDPELRVRLWARLEEEARLTARLDHPSIVAVHEVGRWPDGAPFYAMRLVRGAPLHDEIARGKSPDDRLALLPHVIHVAEALAFAHRQGVVHRDVKPRNVLCGSLGETVLIDWGLARDLAAPTPGVPARAGAIDLTFTRMGLGTPQYMPPEQARGETADPRFDVYALGATLYHLLAGQPPYGDGPATELRRRMLEGPPPRLSQVAPQAPPALVAIVDKAMARRPDERFATAEEVLAELVRFVSGQLTHTHRYSSRELVSHFAHKHRAALRVAAAMLAALAVTATAMAVRVVHERDRAEQSAREARRQLVRALGVTASAQAPQPERRFEALLAGLEAVAMDAVPEAVQGLVDAVAYGPTARVVAGVRGLRPVAWSRDGRQLALLSRSELALWDAASGEMVARWPADLELADGHGADFSPDGRRLIACSRAHHALVVAVPQRTGDPAGSATRLVGGGEVSACWFLPDGRAVTVSSDVVLFDAAGKEVARFPLGSPHAPLARAGARLVVATSDGRLRDFALDAGTVRELPRLAAAPRALHLRPDGSVFVGDSLGGLRRVSPGGVVTVVERQGLNLVGIQVSPSGRRALLTSDRFLETTTLAVDLEAASAWPAGAGYGSFLDDDVTVSVTGGDVVFSDFTTGRQVFRVPGGADGWVVGRPPPQRRMSAVNSGSSEVLRFVDGRLGSAGILLGHTAEVVRVMRLSPDRLLTASLDGTLRAFDAVSGDVAWVLRTGHSVLDVAASEGGDRILAGLLDGEAVLCDGKGNVISRLPPAGAPVSSVALDHAGAVLAVAALDGQVHVGRAGDTASLRALDAGGRAVTALALARDGTRLAAGTPDGAVRLFDTARAVQLGFAPGDPEDHLGIARLAFSPDGRTLLVGRTSRRTSLLSVAGLAATATVDGRLAGPDAVASDGRFLAIPAGSRVVAYDGSGRALRQLPPHDAAVLGAALSADGKRVLSFDVAGEGRVVDLDGDRPPLVLRGPAAGPATAGAFQSGGEEVALGYRDGLVRVFPTTASRARALACETVEALVAASPACPVAERPVASGAITKSR